MWRSNPPPTTFAQRKLTKLENYNYKKMISLIIFKFLPQNTKKKKISQLLFGRLSKLKVDQTTKNMEDFRRESRPPTAKPRQNKIVTFKKCILMFLLFKNTNTTFSRLDSQILRLR